MEINKPEVLPIKKFKSVRKGNSHKKDVLLSMINKLTKIMNKPDSPDKLFMLSLVPELEQLPDEMKFDVKAEILNVFRRAKHQSSVTYSSKQMYSSGPYIPAHIFTQAESTIASATRQFPSVTSTSVSTQTTDFSETDTS